MPSYVTNYVFSATVQHVTAGAAAQAAEACPAAYHWGALGPQPLFYYHAPFSGALGKLAHRMQAESPEALFEALCGAVTEQNSTAALAYALGFCTCYALSRVTYAFLNAQADRLALHMPGFSAEARLRLVANDIDGILISNYIAANPAEYEAFHLFDPAAPECTAVARVLAQTAQSAFGLHVSPASVYHSLGDMHRALSLAHRGIPLNSRLTRMERLAGKAGLAASLMRRPEPLEADCANQAHRVWSSPSGERTDSFADLFNAAVPLAVSLQRAVLARCCEQKPLDPRFFPTNFFGETVKS